MRLGLALTMNQTRVSPIAIAFLLLVACAAALTGSCRSSPPGTVPARPEIEVPAWEPVFKLVESWEEATAEQRAAVAVGRAATMDANADRLTSRAELEALAVVLGAADARAAQLPPVEAEATTASLGALREGLRARLHIAGAGAR